MATRKIVGSFSQKLDSDSEILSLHHERKQQVIIFMIFLKIAFLSPALQQFKQATQIRKVIEFLVNGFPFLGLNYYDTQAKIVGKGA